MRVVAGSAKGTRLLSVGGTSTRPILDRVKVALFDILRPHLEGAAFLDLFAGSGSVGIEALSQGAEHAHFIEIESPAIQVIRKNLAATKLASRATVQHTDAFSFLRRTKDSFDMIFIAPPQYKALWIEALHAIAERPEILNKSGTLIVQIDPKEYEEISLTNFQETEQRKYGSTLLVFYHYRQSSL